MESYKCKLCTRSFTSGRALGGHMKAHFATLPHHHRTPPSSSTLLSFSSSHENSDEKSVTNLSEYIVHDRESETESKNPAQKRSNSNRNRNSEQKKLKQRLIDSHFHSHSPVSSISETSPEKELAKTLMMLSRDKWKMNVFVKEDSQSQSHEVEEIEFRKNSRKHKCDECGQNFRSSTALKSHRNICLQNEVATTRNDHKIFKCLVCSKVFGSGQALGGHKKSHLHPSSKKKLCFIDLNLPPLLQENDARDQCVFYE
ncbi:unnamed protein product [Lathyrus sativus]|nr:unnamed protein product [Lathyrus sativus]